LLYVRRLLQLTRSPSGIDVRSTGKGAAVGSGVVLGSTGRSDFAPAGDLRTSMPGQDGEQIGRAVNICGSTNCGVRLVLNLKPSGIWYVPRPLSTD
jgi:hypothetical protein